MPSHRRRALARAVPVALAAIFSLVFAASAFAHAALSPPVAQDKDLQHFTLAVPTEEAGAVTTTVEFSPPAGFDIDSFDVPPPGWKLNVVSKGSGEQETFSRVTWTGGHVPTGQAAVFGFNASTEGAKTYVLPVRQTYSDGKVVDWSGPESSDTPAPQLKSVSDLGSGSGSTLGIIAIIVGGIALIVGLVAIVTGRRPLA